MICFNVNCENKHLSCLSEVAVDNIQAVTAHEPCAVGLVLVEGTCEIKSVVDGLFQDQSLQPGYVIDAVDGLHVIGSTITNVLAMGIVGSAVQVRALPPKRISSKGVIEVELKRRKAGTGS